ncbi:MAG: acyltransferase [Tatlockia sp.]|nr:acyltransferase [Tatlockia sp.]
MTANLHNSSFSAPSNNFSIEIESLRGIAALLVVAGHFKLKIFGNIYGSLSSKPLVLFTTLVDSMLNPQSTVLLFFTISGLVLGRQLRKNPIEGFPSFIAYLCRRGFRLFPLIWATTIFAFILDSFVHHRNFALLFLNLTLNNISLNEVLWSIQVELWCSLFFPLLFWMFRTSGIIYNVLLFIGFAFLSYFVKTPIFMQFWVFFHAGLLVDVLSTNLNLSRFKNPLILLSAYLIFILAPEFSIGPRNWAYGCWQSWVLPEIIACPLILFFIVHNKNNSVNAFLRLSWIRYLGKISFSVYLIHFPILLYMLAKFPVDTISQILIFSCGFFGSTILISGLAYRWIEIPFNNIGRKLYTYILTDLFSKTLHDKVNGALRKA